MAALRPLVCALLILTLGSPAHSQPASATIDLSNFNFAPEPIRLAAGKPVTLTFVNRSGSGHDFTARRFFASARLLSGSAPNGRLDFAPHQTRSITLVPAAGTFPVHCSHFMHKQMGMRDLIIVR